MNEEKWRSTLASSLDWEQAHASIDTAVKGLPSELRGKRPDNFPHSVWELVEHIRLAQRDLLDFMTVPTYRELEWPKDYWSEDVAPPSEEAWKESLAAIRRDRGALAEIATGLDRDLTERIPRGTGQTYLRTLLVAQDHSSYHVGQIVAVRRLLGAWQS
jgi:uncharacterized damage-inducible protein DinB